MNSFDINDNPLISIIVPIYNGELYIDKCVNSLRGQTYKKIEILVINDGSTDDTERLLKEIETEDSRVRVFSIKNGGVSKARNYGIKQSTGDLIMFVDGDDFVEECYVAEYVRNYTNDDLIIGGYSHYFEGKETTINYKSKNQSYSIKEFLDDITFFLSPPFLLGPCFKLLKSNIIKSNNIYFPVDLSYGEDAEFVFNYLNYCRCVKSIENFGYFYRRHSKETLSTRFIYDKMDIFYRLSNDLKNLLIKNNVTNYEGVTNEMLLNDFILFCHELFASNLGIAKKRKIFFDNVNRYEIKRLLRQKKKKSLAMKLISLAIFTHCFSPLLMLFKINDAKYR